MLHFKIMFKTLVLFILFFSSTAFGGPLFTVEITTKSLNVREIPNVKGKIISSLKKGEKVIVSSIYPGWYTVLVDRDKIGYISKNYVKILDNYISENGRSLDGYIENKCNAKSAEFDLNISNVQMKCKEYLTFEGYESCDVMFYLTINSSCNQNMVAYVNCVIDFTYETKSEVSGRDQ